MARQERQSSSATLPEPLRNAASVLRKVPGAGLVSRATEGALDKVGAVSPRGRRMAVYAGAGVLGVAGVVEWPVAVTGAAVAWLTQPRPGKHGVRPPESEAATGDESGTPSLEETLSTPAGTAPVTADEVAPIFGEQAAGVSPTPAYPGGQEAPVGATPAHPGADAEPAAPTPAHPGVQEAPVGPTSSHPGGEAVPAAPVVPGTGDVPGPTAPEPGAPGPGESADEQGGPADDRTAG